ncbi:MAG: hypothetical protein AAGH15_12280 [Myxococcota bacterium]
MRTPPPKTRPRGLRGRPSRAAALLLAGALIGCSSDAEDPPVDAGGMRDGGLDAGRDAGRDLGTMMDAGQDLGDRVRSSASFGQRIAFEGQRLVNVLTAIAGEDLSGGEVRNIGGAPVTVERAECGGNLCAVVVSIDDDTANLGVFIPNPIDNIRSDFQILTDTTDYRAALSVVALDTIELTSADPARLSQPIQIAASLLVGPEAIVDAVPGVPVRLAIMGDLRFGGTLDLSGASGEAVAGGGDGGEAGGPAEDAGPGAGGGHATPGAGDGAGAVRGTDALACLTDLFSETCGGGGGGGATGNGGAGGGTALLAALGEVDLSGARLLAEGESVASGGGGAGGGLVIGAARPLAAPASVNLGGGRGSDDADGGAGRLRVDAPGARADLGLELGEASAYEGPSVDLRAFDPIVRTDAITLAGEATDGDTIVAETLEGDELARTTVDAGAYSLSVPLALGLNRLQVVAIRPDGERVRSWSGNNFAFDRPDGARRTLPTGATVDVARLP